MGPLLVFEGHPVPAVDVVAVDPEALESRIEAIDVENDEFLCFDALARPVVLRTDGDRIVAVPSGRRADEAAVRERLDLWLAHDDEGPPADEDFAAYLESALRMLGYYDVASPPLGQRPRHRLLHGFAGRDGASRG